MSGLSSTTEVKAFNGNLELLSSGIINITGKELKFTIADLELKVTFDNDTSNIATRLEGEPEGEKTLHVHLINMKNSLLEGFYDPMEIGQVNNRKLLLNLSAWTLDANRNIRTVVYNFLLGEAV